MADLTQVEANEAAWEEHALELYTKVAHAIAAWQLKAKSADRKKRDQARKTSRELLDSLGEYQTALREIADEDQLGSYNLDNYVRSPFFDMVDQVEQVRQDCAKLALNLSIEYHTYLEHEISQERQRMADLMI